MVKKYEQKQIAIKEINNLFEKASKSKTQELATIKIKKARKLAMKFNIRLRRELKRKFCKHCYNYFKHGINVRVRLNRKLKTVTYYCLKCKKFTRFPYLKESKSSS